VKEYEPNRRILLVGEGAKARSRDEIVFEPAGEGTRIVYDASLELKGVYRFARRLVGGEFRRICSRALAGLKARLDASR
jgi:carbon monoxide dehydrogenase subunit G